MARRKTRLQQLTNLKPAVFAGFDLLSRALPPVRSLLAFHPQLQPPPPDRAVMISEDARRAYRLGEPRFAAQLAELTADNWDIHRDVIIDRDPFSGLRQVMLIEDMLITGHTLTPVDPQSGSQIAVGRSGKANWFAARPMFLPRTMIRTDQPIFALNPVWNMWHLLIEFLIPLTRAAMLNAWGDHELLVVTRENRPSVVDALVDGLRATLGVRMRLQLIGATEVIRSPLGLVADNVCWNVERSFAWPETIPVIAQALASSYRGHRADFAPGAKIYITRKGVKLRQIINEDELIELMRGLGYRVFQSTWDNHPDQFAAFSNASAIVGVHGAGLTNILFSRPDTKVMELFPRDHRKTSMLHLSAEMDLSHESFFGGPEEGLKQAFRVDVAALRERLAAMPA